MTPAQATQLSEVHAWVKAVRAAKEHNSYTWWYSTDNGASRHPVRDPAHAKDLADRYGLVDAYHRAPVANWDYVNYLYPAQLDELLGPAK